QERPGYQRRVREDRVVQPVGRQAGEAAEDDAEDDHERERLGDGAADLQQRLAVAGLDLALGEGVHQLAVLPELENGARGEASVAVDDGDRARPRRVCCRDSPLLLGGRGAGGGGLRRHSFASRSRTYAATRSAARPSTLWHSSTATRLRPSRSRAGSVRYARASSIMAAGDLAIRTAPASTS